MGMWDKKKKPVTKQKKVGCVVVIIGGLLMLFGSNIGLASLFIVGGAVVYFLDKDD